MSSNTFRTRQAPSPTGYLHLGTARTVLFTKLLSVVNSGSWFLRLEDTDRNRLNSGAVVPLLSALQALGLDPDEGVTLDQNGQKDEFYGIYQKGEFGPYIQSERLPIYHKHAQNLIDQKLAYWVYLSEEERNELQEIKKIDKKPINYFLRNLEKVTEAEIYKSVSEGLKDERKPVLRYRLQRKEVIECHDQLLGKSSFDLSLEEDFTILKSDGFPTYHLAHLVDDFLMKTSLVIRAQEWFSSLPKHVVMFQDYWGKQIETEMESLNGKNVPDYLHLPFVLGETGNKKMSKRDGNVNMQDYLDKGYLPEALVNYLAFLGWNPGTEKELYLDKSDFQILDQKARLQKLISNLATDFSLSKLSKSAARFSTQKLDWFNREYLKMMTLEEFSLLANQNRLLNSPDINLDKSSKRFRVGDYAFLADLETQKVFACDDGPDWRSFGGNYYLVGGGREPNQSPIENLHREIQEETEGRISLNEEKIQKMGTFKTLESFDYAGEGHYDGKEFHLYFYPLKEAELPPFLLQDNGSYETYWIKIQDFVIDHDYFKFPLWKNFCEQNNLPLFEPNLVIKQQYLAWFLDKNRIAVLSELGLESGCILDYTKPSCEEIKWKKSSIEESLENLKEIGEVILNLYSDSEIVAAQKTLYDEIFSNNLEKNFSSLTELWELKIKAWLTENDKKTGDYLWPLRVTLSGKQKSPSPFELLAILDKEEAGKRIVNE
jgi:glutamyl-tRNA synthetase